MHHRRGPWSSTEDASLLTLVSIHGAHNWVRISNLLTSRTPKQCRERYHQNLKPSLNHDPITPDEGALIEKLVLDMGKRWAEIARHLNGRSDNAVKNWWNGGQNRRRRITRRQRDGYPRRRRDEEEEWECTTTSSPSPRALTIDVRSRRDSCDAHMVSPGLSEMSGMRTPSLSSDASSTFSISPRAPASPIHGTANTLPPLLGFDLAASRQSFSSYRAEPRIIDPAADNFYQQTPRYAGERLRMFVDECTRDLDVKLPSLSQFDEGVPATAPNDGRMSLSNILG